jgi:hypothetical protein
VSGNQTILRDGDRQAAFAYHSLRAGAKSPRPDIKALRSDISKETKSFASFLQNRRIFFLQRNKQKTFFIHISGAGTGGPARSPSAYVG